VGDDIVVPDAKPDIKKVLDIRGNVVVKGYDVIQDRVMAEGIIQYSILYIGDKEEQPISAMEAETGFTQYLEIAGVKPKMSAKLKADLEHIDFDILNSRKINIKAVLNLDAQVSQPVQMEAVQDFKEPDDVQVLKEKIRVQSSAGEGSTQTMFREDLELPDNMPSVELILRKDARVRIVDKKAADNKVIVHGELVLGILYLCAEENEPIHYFSQEIPFTHFVEIQGAYQGMPCEAEAEVREIFVDPKENINDERRILDIEAVLALRAQVFETDDLDIVVDAYSPSADLELKKKNVSIKQIVGENQVQNLIKQDISFPNNIPQASRILYADVKGTVTDQAIIDGKVIVEGILTADIIYQFEDEKLQIHSYKEEIPFRQGVEIAGIDEKMDCYSQLSIDQVHYNLIAPDEVELRVLVGIKAAAYRTVDKEILLGAEITEKKTGPSGGIYIYFVKAGDSLWSIAKRYNTTVANILKYNALEDQENLVPGSKLIIYKKYDYKVS